MKPKHLFFLLPIIIASLFFLVVSASAQGGFSLDWWSVDGGGGASTGGIYSLGGTIGQHDAGVVSGGNFVLSGGFWLGGEAGVPPPFGDLFLPLILR